ncbi:hypothetical protein VCRA2113O324_610002 [Vibrio crassostreae]|nr:hypothetical protein VCRA2119O381_3960001 [Vibrio crassostreae]CAK2180880.1 hypothetical protein VCRA2113O324_610002 [Vibrio crassostreae]CAK2197855.1 hypothetical protein VCRA2111O320_660002 [Vibrio crassostreae]CAK3063430.1 hypothetical protein VCRA2121O336_690002 [Vibrio crassostreae]CAK4000501.1 hypothetical protein VCRA2128O347_610001 [Vibrio crassostreae]
MSKLAFCKINDLNPSTFYAKRQQLKETVTPHGVIRAEVVKKQRSIRLRY